MYCPLHIISHSSIEKQQKAHTTTNQIVCAYLRVGNKTLDGSSTRGSQDGAKTPANVVTKTCQSLLQALHESIDHSLQNVKKSAFFDLEFQKRDSERISLQRMIFFGIVNILKYNNFSLRELR